jgi:hypothetical protein
MTSSSNQIVIFMTSENLSCIMFDLAVTHKIVLLHIMYKNVTIHKLINTWCLSEDCDGECCDYNAWCYLLCGYKRTSTTTEL